MFEHTLASTGFHAIRREFSNEDARYLRYMLTKGFNKNTKKDTSKSLYEFDRTEKRDLSIA